MESLVRLYQHDVCVRQNDEVLNINSSLPACDHIHVVC